MRFCRSLYRLLGFERKFDYLYVFEISQHVQSLSLPWHLSRVPPAALSRNHITSKRLLLTGSLSNDDGEVKENAT